MIKKFILLIIREQKKYIYLLLALYGGYLITSDCYKANLVAGALFMGVFLLLLDKWIPEQSWENDKRKTDDGQD